MSEAAGTGAPNTPAGGSGEGTGGQPAGNNGTPAGGQPNGQGGQPNGQQGGQPNGQGQGEVEYKFDFPEDMPVDEGELNDFKSTAKELGLNPEQAKKLVDLRVKYAQSLQAKHAEAVGKWRGDSQVDKEFGGDKFQENLAVALKARDTFATDELKSLLQSTRLGDHPEVVRLFYRVGKALAEDKFVKQGATTGASGTKSTADILYGTN